MSTFGDLRSLLHGAYTLEEQNERWEDLLAMLESAHKSSPDEVEEQWLPYALIQLESWEDEAKMAPRDWVNKLIRGISPGVLMALVRAIDVARIGNPRFLKVCENDAFQWVTHLSFGGHKIMLESIRALATSRNFTNLTSLVFHDTNLGSVKLNALARASFIPTLKTLRLPNCELGGNEAKVIFDKFPFEALHHLDLRDNPLYGSGARELREAELPTLKTLTLSSYTSLDIIEECLRDSSWAGSLERFELVLNVMSVRKKLDDMRDETHLRRYLRERPGVANQQFVPAYKEELERILRYSALREEVWMATLARLPPGC